MVSTSQPAARAIALFALAMGLGTLPSGCEKSYGRPWIHKIKIDGAKQVIIDPSSSDGKPIVLCTNLGYSTVVKYNAAISSLLFHDGWLYVAERGGSGASGRLIRINVDSGPDFLKKQQSLGIPGVEAAFGFGDIAINSGRYLAVTAAAGRIGLNNYPVPSPGNVYVIDLYGVNAKSNIDPAYVVKLDLLAYPSTYLGMGPLYIGSGQERGQFLVSNAKDYNKGAAGITLHPYRLPSTQ